MRSTSLRRPLWAPVAIGFLLGAGGGGVVKYLGKTPEPPFVVPEPLAVAAPVECEPVVIEVETTVPTAAEGRYLEIPLQGGGECVRVAEGVKAVLRIETEDEEPDVHQPLSPLAPFMHARILPTFENGRAIGFEVFSIRPGSIYAKIGIQNGDVVKRINGHEISTAYEALEVYSQLQNERHFVVEVRRRGQTRILEYTIE